MKYLINIKRSLGPGPYTKSYIDNYLKTVYGISGLDDFIRNIRNCYCDVYTDCSKCPLGNKKPEAEKACSLIGSVEFPTIVSVPAAIEHNRKYSMLLNVDVEKVRKFVEALNALRDACYNGDCVMYEPCPSCALKSTGCMRLCYWFKMGKEKLMDEVSY